MLESFNPVNFLYDYLESDTDARWLALLRLVVDDFITAPILGGKLDFWLLAPDIAVLAIVFYYSLVLILELFLELF